MAQLCSPTLVNDSPPLVGVCWRWGGRALIERRGRAERQHDRERDCSRGWGGPGRRERKEEKKGDESAGGADAHCTPLLDELLRARRACVHAVSRDDCGTRGARTVVRVAD